MTRKQASDLNPRVVDTWCPACDGIEETIYFDAKRTGPKARIKVCTSCSAAGFRLRRGSGDLYQRVTTEHRVKTADEVEAARPMKQKAS